MSPTRPNTLYYGDNLDILRRYIGDESVDLVYLDPPFQSQRDYNVLFQEHDGSRAAAQIRAFEDTWRWDAAAEGAYDAMTEAGGSLSDVLRAFRTFLGTNDLMAYLAMMAPRLAELHRVLKSTGSLYLHCDPTASHYLKMLLDAVFGPKQFRSEIVWKRSSAHSDTKQGRKIHGHIHDIVLFYTRSDQWTWNPIYTPYDKDYLESEYRHATDGGRYYKETDVTAAKPGGDTEFEWRIKRPEVGKHRWQADLDSEHERPKPGWLYQGVRPYSGRFWAYTRKNLVQFWHDGKLIHRETGMPRLMHFADEMPGVSLQDLWTDIPPEMGANDMGYPTQKPIALLERIVQSSSNPDDVVLDPFCGCGTTIAAAQATNRRWIGIDITHLAIALLKHRLTSTFGEDVAKTYETVGEPVSLPDAQQLAKDDRYQFQWWAVGLVGARPTPKDQKKGADKGIDGRLFFHDEQSSKKDATKTVILQVKSGHVKVGDVRDLRGVLDREKAQIGVVITLEESTGPMRTEAASAGFYDSPGWRTKHPRLQILTIAELLAGKTIDMPPIRQTNVTFKRAPKAKKGADAVQPALDFDADDDGNPF